MLKCLRCQSKTTVIDSRYNSDLNRIRRRRQCTVCKARYTTREVLEDNFVKIRNKKSRICQIQLHVEKIGIFRLLTFFLRMPVFWLFRAVCSDDTFSRIQDLLQKQLFSILPVFLLLLPFFAPFGLLKIRRYCRITNILKPTQKRKFF